MSFTAALLMSWVIPRVTPFWPLEFAALRAQFRAPHTVKAAQQGLIVAALCLGAIRPELLVFSVLALTLCLFDFKYEILPDAVTFALAASGAAAVFLAVGPDLADAIFGMVLGGGMLGILRFAYLRIKGVEALGFGDVKLAATLGLWIGGAAMPWILVGASLMGLAVAALTGQDRLAFGPWLIAPAWAFLIAPPWYAAMGM